MEKTINPQDAIRDNLIKEYTEYTKRQAELFPDGLNAQRVITAILQLQHDKEAVYGQSWRKYGMASAFLNTARKWDRIDNIMRKALEQGEQVLTSNEAGTAQETFMDTLVDLASYSLLWVGFMAEQHPEMWQKFMEMNRLTQGNCPVE